MSGQPGFAPEEFQKLRFLGGGCVKCAKPLDLDFTGESQCVGCELNPPHWDRARAALAYDDSTRKMVLDLKRGGRRDGLCLMTNWMSLTAADLLSDTDWLVPVPLHYQRLAKRGFNQSVWLAQGVGKHARTLTLVDALIRTRATETQEGKSARERQANVADAFEVRESRRNRIEGTTVTLIDDVLTTGATANACAAALKEAGAAKVNLLVLTRVVREEDVTI